MRYEADSIPKDAAEAIRPAFAISLSDDTDHWIEQCRLGNAQFWRSADGAYSAITEVREIGGARVFHMVASAGEFRLELLEEGEAWGLAMGCTKAVTEGRLGWGRVLPNYKTATCQFIKDL